VADSEPFVELFYLRRLCSMSTFLQENTAEIFEDDDASITNSTSSADAETTECSPRRCVVLQHPEVKASSFNFDPSSDVLWLSHEAELETIHELKQFYGDQMNAIENIIVDELSLWDDLEELEKAWKMIDLLGGVRKVYVWLESHRFESGTALTSNDGYIHRARELEARDKTALRGKGLAVDYIDLEGNVYGGVQSAAVCD
jgi:hypothetical protein